MDIHRLLNKLLLSSIKEDASDIHFSVGRPPTLRIDGRLIPLVREKVLTPEAAEELCLALLTEEQKQKFLRALEIDFSYSFEDKVRFRVNVFRQKGYISAALRVIPTRIKTIEELSLPIILNEFTKPSQGFVLIVGPSGHGKSTTLAALIDKINHERPHHIITIEDPIEYVFRADKAIVDQREVGRDTESFARALRSSFREDPDVIMVGEMRDPETMGIAVTAAETGHLVFATLHTNNAAQTVDRIIDTFPPYQQSQIKTQLAATLTAIVSQRLVPSLKGGRIPACEVMLANSAVRNIIREGKIHQVDLVIETSSEEGMFTLNNSLAGLVRNGLISMENAEKYSLNLSELRTLLEK